MDDEFKKRIKEFRALKKLGQNFLVNEDIAASEAQYAIGKHALEIGPGFGVLTRQLCMVSKAVTAVEKDKRLFELLSTSLEFKNLSLIHGDFFKLAPESFSNPDILVSNIPYNLSSKTVSWLTSNGMEALLCLQKEFVEHMLAEPGSKKYSRLSVTTQLSFKAYRMMDVPRNNFYPVPKVDSSIVYLKPVTENVPGKQELTVIALLMEHKKKLLRNALIDSSASLSLSDSKARALAESLSLKEKRVFTLTPNELADSASEILEAIGISG